jgi:hypothetical protein
VTIDLVAHHFVIRRLDDDTGLVQTEFGNDFWPFGHHFWRVFLPLLFYFWIGYGQGDKSMILI